ncbi:hypothetical protein [Aliiruegeria sabulilitoris]|uniref:hypothetical protein n=1 Tax=Aliiruegeria sabulilitoris TaxID=1510458 RepID=UPI0008320493|nr:hypothetical protein [Aliiruegeria sabulilitoris]NDR59510.1 hypothetical protein [Pseudoruegeria sp. M32A2M]
MKKTIIATLVAGLTMPLGTAAFANDRSQPAHPESSPKGTIHVSCYRGALKNTVAWDRPNAVFIEDLVKYGYSMEQAHSLGMRVCRDEWGVGDSEHQINTMKRLLREHPVGSKF